MKAQSHRLRLLNFESILHDLRPDAANAAEFCDLLEKIRLRDEIKREPWREGIGRNTSLDDFFDIRNTIGDGESSFLHSRRAGFGDVIAADVDGVISRHVLRAEHDDVTHNP